MKYLHTLLATLAAVLVLAACNKPNEPVEPQPEATLVGTWECTAATVFSDGEETPSNYLIGIKYIFNEDGTATINTYPCTYTYSDSTLVLTYEDDYVETLTVLGLTETELRTYEKIVLDEATNHNEEQTLTFKRK